MGGVEAAASDYVFVNVPSHPLGRLNAARIPFAIGDLFNSPFQIRSATGQHDGMAEWVAGERVGVKGFSRRRRCERSEHP